MIETNSEQHRAARGPKSRHIRMLVAANAMPFETLLAVSSAPYNTEPRHRCSSPQLICADMIMSARSNQARSHQPVIRSIMRKKLWHPPANMMPSVAMEVVWMMEAEQNRGMSVIMTPMTSALLVNRWGKYTTSDPAVQCTGCTVKSTATIRLWGSQSVFPIE